MVNCVHCGKRFKAQKDLDMHCKAVHRSFDCSVCFKKFKTPQSKNQHFEAVHAESYRPDPPVLSAGEWVHWDEFKGTKASDIFCVTIATKNGFLLMHTKTTDRVAKIAKHTITQNCYGSISKAVRDAGILKMMLSMIDFVVKHAKLERV